MAAAQAGYAGTRRVTRGRNLPKKWAEQGRQMPWLTLGAPALMTPLHHAQTRVSGSGPAFVTFFILLLFDCYRSQLFKESAAPVEVVTR